MKSRTLHIPLIRIGSQIARIRKKQGLSLDEVSMLTAIAKTRLEQIEKGRINMTYLELAAMSRVLDHEVHELVYLPLVTVPFVVADAKNKP